MYKIVTLILGRALVGEMEMSLGKDVGVGFLSCFEGLPASSKLVLEMLSLCDSFRNLS